MHSAPNPVYHGYRRSAESTCGAVDAIELSMFFWGDTGLAEVERIDIFFQESQI